MDIKSFRFPLHEYPVHVLILCLSANGDSSYRDADSMARIMIDRFHANVTILSDNPRRPFKSASRQVRVHIIQTKDECIHHMNEIVRKLPPKSNLLFLISAHGYSESAAGVRKQQELNGRSEYLRVGRTILYDYDLFSALYDNMHLETRSLCLVDTCHSGTMLDLEYLSTDGGRTFKRSCQSLAVRPWSVCISACGDSECTGEDVSQYGGWGGKLASMYFDFILGCGDSFCVHDFFTRVFAVFQGQALQRTSPVLSYNT